MDRNRRVHRPFHPPTLSTMDRPNHQEQQAHVRRAAIVVVAKCPIAGKSKTRLIPLLGEEGSARLAKAMLSDVLQTLSQQQVRNQCAHVAFIEYPRFSLCKARHSLQVVRSHLFCLCPTGATGERNIVGVQNPSLCPAHFRGRSSNARYSRQPERRKGLEVISYPEFGTTRRRAEKRHCLRNDCVDRCVDDISSWSTAYRCLAASTATRAVLDHSVLGNGCSRTTVG